MLRDSEDTISKLEVELPLFLHFLFIYFSSEQIWQQNNIDDKIEIKAKNTNDYKKSIRGTTLSATFDQCFSVWL